MQLVSLGQFNDILPGHLLERMALEYHVDRSNHVRLPGQAVFACLLDAVLHQGEISQRILEDTYFRKTAETADHSSFGKRLAKISPSYFQSLFEYLFEQLSPDIRPGEAKALRIQRIDATTVTLSAKLISFGLLYSHTGRKRTGKPYRAIKSVFSLDDEGLPRFLRLAIAREENSDDKALGRALHEHVRANDLWVFDAGCHDREVLWDLHHAKAYFLTPHSTQRLNVVRTIKQVPIDELIQGAPQEHDPQFQIARVETARFGTAADRKKWLPLPLLVVHGQRWDLRSKQWKPMTLMTNLPLSQDETHAGSFTFEEIGALYRRRWEIETFFKCLKQHLGYEHLVSRTQNGVEVMIYMSLIAALLLIWYQRLTKIDRGWRSVKYHLAGDVEEWAKELLSQTMRLKRPSRETYSRAA